MPYFRENQISLSQAQCEALLKSENPLTSYATPLDPTAHGFVIYFSSPQPDHNPITQTFRETTPVLTEKGRYEQAWEIVPRFTEYTDEQGVTHTVIEQESAAIAADQAAAVQSLVRSITDATQKRLDDFARTRNYDGILSACTYASSTVPMFAAEGQCAVNVRDATWAALYAIMAEVQAGARPMPAGFLDVEPDLPTMTWPS